MRRFGIPFLALLAAAALSVAGAGVARGADDMHKTGKVLVKLSPAPKTDTPASGNVLFTLSKDGKTLRYELKLAAIENVTMAHVHEVASGGLPGAVVAWLYPAGEERAGLSEGTFFGTLVTGDIDAARLRGPMKDGTVEDLFEKIGHGKAGVAVHTKANPGGELWGVHSAAEKSTRIDLLAPCKCAEQ